MHNLNYELTQNDLYRARDVGTGLPYAHGVPVQGDRRGADREATQDSKRGFTRKDMARATKQHSDGSRKRSSG
jgi:hypothetical protein